MCGITGFRSPAIHNPDELRARVRQMTETLAHLRTRRPGLVGRCGLGRRLGHRRLSILDLSELGRQPMLSASGRFVVILNGEVYTHGALRRELQGLGHTFRGHSDTEVLLAAVVEWGLQRAVKRFVGMFAFALWDRDGRELALVRDAIGIKPLYYGWMQGCFLFGSELKALRAHPAFHGEIDRGPLSSYLHHCYVPGPNSIYRGFSVAARLDPRGAARHRPGRAEPVAWWSMAERVEEGLRHPFSGTDEEAVDELDARLRDSVALQMLADVPVGAFLSGGIDSSTVVALDAGASTRPVRTFSIGFEERLRRGGLCQGGRRAPRHRPHRVLRDAGRGSRSDSAAPATVRRAVCRFVADSHFPGQPDRPPRRDGEPRRRRRRAVRGYDRYRHLERLWQRVAWCPLGPRAVVPLVRWAAAAVPPGVRQSALGDDRRSVGGRQSQPGHTRFNSHWRDLGDRRWGCDRASGRPAACWRQAARSANRWPLSTP